MRRSKWLVWAWVIAERSILGSVVVNARDELWPSDWHWHDVSGGFPAWHRCLGLSGHLDYISRPILYQSARTCIRTIPVAVRPMFFASVHLISPKRWRRDKWSQRDLCVCERDTGNCKPDEQVSSVSRFQPPTWDLLLVIASIFNAYNSMKALRQSFIVTDTSECDLKETAD